METIEFSFDSIKRSFKIFFFAGQLHLYNTPYKAIFEKVFVLLLFYCNNLPLTIYLIETFFVVV